MVVVDKAGDALRCSFSAESPYWMSEWDVAGGKPKAPPSSGGGGKRGGASRGRGGAVSGRRPRPRRAHPRRHVSVLCLYTRAHRPLQPPPLWQHRRLCLGDLRSPPGTDEDEEEEEEEEWP